MPKTTTPIWLDVGSSTIKVYKQRADQVELVSALSVPFKTGFEPAKGLAQGNKQKLFEILQELQLAYPNTPIRIIATALFRQLTKSAKTSLVEEVLKTTGLTFEIISQDQENYYLQVALLGKYLEAKPILLINIGGGSSQLVNIKNQQVVSRYNLEFGVGTILDQFPKINEPVAGSRLHEVVDFVVSRLPKFKEQVSQAIYTGGELRYMELAGYHLIPNELFQDPDHPKMILTTDFGQQNKTIFDQISLTKLESLMPDNPSWMHGARACSAIAQAICEKFGVVKIVPSNSNICHGAARLETKKFSGCKTQ